MITLRKTLASDRREHEIERYGWLFEISAQMNHFDQCLTRALTSVATWSTAAEEYWVNAVKVSNDAYTKFTHVNRAERAA